MVDMYRNEINEKEVEELILSILQDEGDDFCSTLVTKWDVFLNFNNFNLIFKLHGEFPLEIYSRIIKLFKSLNQNDIRYYTFGDNLADLKADAITEFQNYNLIRILFGYSFINIPKDIKFTLEELMELEFLVKSCLKI